MTESGIVHKFGLDLTQEDFGELGDELQRITDAERQAWRDSQGIIVGNRTLAAARIETHRKSDELHAEGEQ